MKNTVQILTCPQCESAHNFFIGYVISNDQKTGIEIQVQCEQNEGHKWEITLCNEDRKTRIFTRLS